MTLHAFIEHKCSYCGTHFVPLHILPKCPKCGRKSSKVFDNFIEDTIRSSLYNLTKYGSFVPPSWGTFTVVTTTTGLHSDFSLLHPLHLK